MGKVTRTLSTKVSIEEYSKFVKRAKQLGMSPSALLRQIVVEFLGKPPEDYDRVSRLEKEVEKLKAEILEMRTRIDMITRRIMLLERRRIMSSTAYTSRTTLYSVIGS